MSENSTKKAAERNFVSQPAISQGIRKLEEQLDLSLLSHQKKTLSPTDAGLFVLDKSQYLFEAIEEFRGQIDEYKNEVSGKLNIGISKSITGKYFSDALKNFLAKNSKIDLKIIFGKTEDQKELLEQKKIDLAIAINHGNLKNNHCKKVSTGKFLLLGKKNCEPNLLITEPRPETTKLISHLKMKKNSSFYHKQIQIESWSVILQMIQSGLGYGLVPDFLISKPKTFVNMGEKLRVPELTYEIVYFYSKNYPLNFAAKKFLPHLEQSYQ